MSLKISQLTTETLGSADYVPISRAGSNFKLNLLDTLNAFVGSSNITTLGTISSGIWSSNGDGSVFSSTQGGSLRAVYVNHLGIDLVNDDEATISVIPEAGAGDVQVKIPHENGTLSTKEWNCLRFSTTIPCSTGAWTLAQSLTGAPSVSNAADHQHRMTIICSTTGQGGYLRQFLNMSGSGSYLPGKSNEIDCTKNWTAYFRFAATSGSSAYKSGVYIGGVASASPPTTPPPLTSKGWAFSIQGTGATSGNISCHTHDGTTATNSSTAAITLDGSYNDIVIKWVAGAGLYAYVNGVLACQVTTNLPTGQITGSKNGWVTIAEHTVGTIGSSTTFIHPITVSFDR